MIILILSRDWAIWVMLRMYYGAWYMEPDTWQRRHGRQVETRGGAEREDNTKVSRRETDFILRDLFFLF